MANWQVLTDLAANQLVTESHMDDIRNNINYLGNFYHNDKQLKTFNENSPLAANIHCQLTRNADLNLAVNSYTTVTWNVQGYAYSGMHTIGSSNIVLPKAGYYGIYFSLGNTTPAFGNSQVFKYKLLMNSVSTLIETGEESAWPHLFGIFYGAANSYLDLQIYQNNTVPEDVTAHFNSTGRSNIYVFCLGLDHA